MESALIIPAIMMSMVALILIFDKQIREFIYKL
jgi:hypothetical protein